MIQLLTTTPIKQQASSDTSWDDKLLAGASKNRALEAPPARPPSGGGVDPTKLKLNLAKVSLILFLRVWGLGFGVWGSITHSWILMRSPT
jgi:hypothetical protein